MCNINIKNSLKKFQALRKTNAQFMIEGEMITDIKKNVISSGYY